MSKELIRAAGGIVHADGNIFFTNQALLDAYVCAISQPVKQAYPTDAQLAQYLRDYFAANAMTSIIAKFPAIKDKKDGEKFMAACAESAYGFADAMLKARELK